MTKANRQRGEVKIEGPEGKEYKMCLTLGAIAQIEEDLGVESLTKIDEVMAKARMRDVLTIFVALLNGGGHTEITSKDMISWDVTIQDLMVKIRECFNAAGFEAEENEDNAGDDNEGN
ncbi:MAG: gene transfer agent family protein [Geminicoccaceae bacterium]|nr:gene transfer agent family protein [Geminicoccaceae bacterium]